MLARRGPILVPNNRRSAGAGARSGRSSRRSRRSTDLPPDQARALEAALAGLAHDIRTPLTGIVALAELLHASDLPERQRGWTAALRASADHLARLTNLVVDAAKAGATGLALRGEPFALREFALSIATALKARAEAKGLQVRISIARNLPAAVIGDMVRLRSALENLIDNAVKFTERGRVTFGVTAAPALRDRLRLTFTIADNGIGIAAADLKRLFRPFAQGNDDIARRFGGAGLGLVFVRRIAQTLGGGLTVRSTPGRGSTFQLSAVFAKTPTAATTPRGRPVAKGGLQLVCAEDNAYGRVVLGTVLRELGHRVTFVGSGERAVAAAKRGSYDAMLMDIVLAGVDGIEATRRIRRLRGSAAQIPIIGVSGRSDSEDEAAALAAGMNAYLRKPVSPAALSETLAAVAGANAA